MNPHRDDIDIQRPLLNGLDHMKQLERQIGNLMLWSICGWLMAGMLLICLLLTRGCRPQHVSLPTPSLQAFILPTAQCSRGTIQSRPIPARTLKVMESAGHHTRRNAAPDGIDCETAGVATAHGSASGNLFSGRSF